jgi:hypothetical protein
MKSLILFIIATLLAVRSQNLPVYEIRDGDQNNFDKFEPAEDSLSTLNGIVSDLPDLSTTAAIKDDLDRDYDFLSSESSGEFSGNKREKREIGENLEESEVIATTLEGRFCTKFHRILLI